MKRTLTLICALVFGIPAFADDNPVPFEHSGNYWLAQCSPQATKQNANCAYFISGLTKGADAHAAITESKALFCIPSGVTNGQAADIFYKYLSDHPESRHMDSSLLAFLAFRSAFPCKK